MSDKRFTKLQGQYLAFIHNYLLMNKRSPAEMDMQLFFGVTPPSVHQMVVTLDKRGLISRIPGQARSIQVLVPAEEIPPLEAPREKAGGTYVRMSRAQKEALKKGFWRMLVDEPD